MRGRVFVEYDADGQICRIFRHSRNAVLSAAWEQHNVAEYARKDAVGIIRKRVFDLAEGFCKDCGKLASWDTGHMHEEVSRGNGGEVSIYNSIWLCYDCHINGRHGERAPRFGEKTEEK